MASTRVGSGTVPRSARARHARDDGQRRLFLLQEPLDVPSPVEHRNDRERPALRVVDDEIRIDPRELNPPIGQVLARVADAGSLGELPDSVVDRVPHANGR